MATKKKSPSVADLCARVEFLEDKLSGYEDLKRRVEVLESSIIFSNNCQKLLLKKVDDAEQYTRRLNLIVRGVPVLKSSSDNDIRQLVISELRRLQIPISDSEVDRAHRIRKPYKDDKGKMQVPIIVRFTSWFARNLVYEKRRQSQFYWSADITERRQKLLTKAKNELSIVGSSAHKLVKSVVVDRNCRLVAISKDDRIFAFNCEIELQRVIQTIEDSQAPYEHIWKLLENDKNGIGYPVINIDRMHTPEWLAEVGNVYVGDGGNLDLPKSKWANPFRSGVDGSVNDVLNQYRSHVASTPNLFNDLSSLRGKVLGCHCDIEDSSEFCCHAQVLQELVGNL